MIGKKCNSSFNVSKTLCKDSWILDIGAIDHKTSLFGDHNTVANRTCIPTSEYGNISLLLSLNLKDVLYVQKHFNNLIFVEGNLVMT